MAVAIVIMLITEWKTKFRWVPILWIPGLFGPVIIQQMFIEKVNDQFIAGVSDMDTLLKLLDEWMFLNDLRWIILSIMWGVMMYFFIAKARQKA